MRRWTVAIVVAFSALYFVGAITYGNFRLFAWEDVGVFYDYQADSLLHGHWDVPDQAIHNEAFLIGGKAYGYFGPTPALLRMPVILFHPPFGHLGRVYMLVYFVGSLAAAYALLRDAIGILREERKRRPYELSRKPGGQETDEPSVWATVVLLASAGLGSPLLFLAGRPMMYTEAIACGAVFALWSAWCSLRWLRNAEGLQASSQPTATGATQAVRRWWVGALVCGVLAVQARPTSGLFALTLLAAVAVWLVVRDVVRWMRRAGCSERTGASALPGGDGCGHRPRVQLLPFAVPVLCLLGVLSVNGVAYLKFGTFDSVPIQISRPYLGNDRFERVEHKKFHLVNVPWGFDCYFVSGNLKFEKRFPYVVMAYRHSADFHPKAKIDLPDFTVAAPFSMPALLVLGAVGGAIAFGRFGATRLPLALLWTAVLPMAVTMFGFIAVAQRYLADFCPWLICSAAFGTAAISVGVGAWWRVVRATLVVLTVVGVLLSAAILFDYQCNWGPLVPDVQRSYQATRDRITDWIGRW